MDSDVRAAFGNLRMKTEFNIASNGISENYLKRKK